MLSKIKMIMSNVCLSDVASGCKYNGNCERHQDEALGKLIAEHDKQIRKDTIDGCIDKFAEIMINIPLLCNENCPVDCDWRTEETCKEKLRSG